MSAVMRELLGAIHQAVIQEVRVGCCDALGLLGRGAVLAPVCLDNS